MCVCCVCLCVLCGRQNTCHCQYMSCSNICTIPTTVYVSSIILFCSALFISALLCSALFRSVLFNFSLSSPDLFFPIIFLEQFFYNFSIFHYSHPNFSFYFFTIGIIGWFPLHSSLPPPLALHSYFIPLLHSVTSIFLLFAIVDFFEFFWIFLNLVTYLS